uniref:Uncharacterized protein n=1 Tax=Glossina palpalis gambiensis TaxID=67801 RepID=A0A1B0BG07_9MUSC
MSAQSSPQDGYQKEFGSKRLYKVLRERLSLSFSVKGSLRTEPSMADTVKLLAVVVAAVTVVVMKLNIYQFVKTGDLHSVLSLFNDFHLYGFIMLRHHQKLDNFDIYFATVKKKEQWEDMICREHHICVSPFVEVFLKIDGGLTLNLYTSLTSSRVCFMTFAGGRQTILDCLRSSLYVCPRTIVFECQQLESTAVPYKLSGTASLHNDLVGLIIKRIVVKRTDGMLVLSSQKNAVNTYFRDKSHSLVDRLPLNRKTEFRYIVSWTKDDSKINLWIDIYVLPKVEEMSKAAQLQALYARRRQAEDDRIERTQELNRYYDHWGKVTTRFANWTAPEYYDKAGQQLQQTKDKKEKEKGLAIRQRKLSEIFTTEKKTFDREMNELKRVRSRKVSTDTLEKIDENLKNQDKIRRKLELEAKLYGKLRHGVDDENLVFDSKSENETLAKLNWLDKQVNTQLEREREEAKKQEQILLLQEKQIKLEQLQKERHAMREREIQEVRTIQENYMLQLKERQEESENLKSEEKKLRDNIDELGKELELLKETDVVMQKPADLAQAYNFKRIKTFIRKRSEEFRNHIKIHIAILERTLDYAKKVTIADELIEKYKKLLDFEAQYVSQIEAMYESEAKSCLLRSEENWTRQHRERCNEINQYLDNESKAFKVQLTDNLERQEDVIELRTACLSVIEDVSAKLKQLIKEEEESPRGNQNSQELLSSSSSEAKKVRFETNAKTAVSPSSLPEITKSFNNLNLDVWQDLPSSRRGIDTLPTNNNPNIVTPENVERPKYGRKRSRAHDFIVISFTNKFFFFLFYSFIYFIVLFLYIQ